MRQVIVLALLGAACAPTPQSQPASTVATTTTTTSTTVVDEWSLGDAVVPLDSAIYDPETLASPVPVPVALSVEGVAVDSARVVPVGVEENGEMEIPGAKEVGWYRFGPTPAQDGSSVLAAHIAWNGRNGVFRSLARVKVGALVTVEYDDGSLTRHVVTEVAQYSKDRLPIDRVFAKSGPAILALITCGGAFNPSLDSYDDNIVVYAVPVS